MKIGVVKGSVVASAKHPIYIGHRLLLVEPIDHHGNKSGAGFVAIDQVQAGPGDKVIYVDEGNSARTVLNDPKAPARAVLVAIVDRINVEAGS